MFRIEIESDKMEPKDWAAIASVALLMGGEAAVAALEAANLDLSPASATATVPAPPPPAPKPANPAALADALMSHEANRVAATTPPEPTIPPYRPVPVPPGVELDADGLPWDMRIHAGSKDKNKDDRWTKKRGLKNPEGEALVRTVEAELRAVMSAPTPTSDAAPVPPPPPAADFDAAFPAGAEAQAAAAPPPPPETPAAPPPPPPVADTASEFKRIMTKVVGLQSAGKLTTEQTTLFAQSVGVTGVGDFVKRPDLIPSFEQMLPA